jgi:hypothetical protein
MVVAHARKQQLQELLAEQIGLEVTVIIEPALQSGTQSNIVCLAQSA